jgi:hypothetical protein
VRVRVRVRVMCLHDDGHLLLLHAVVSALEVLARLVRVGVRVRVRVRVP